MKATIDLLGALVREIERRALQAGRMLEDVVADLLRQGSSAPAGSACRDPGSVLARGEQTGLPVVACRHAVRPGEDLTPERIAQILIDQAAERRNDLAG